MYYVIRRKAIEIIMITQYVYYFFLESFVCLPGEALASMPNVDVICKYMIIIIYCGPLSYNLIIFVLISLFSVMFGTLRGIIAEFPGIFTTATEDNNCNLVIYDAYITNTGKYINLRVKCLDRVSQEISK